MTATRKHAIVNAVLTGQATLAEILERYNMPAEEFHTMLNRSKKYGTRGLRIRNLQKCRDVAPRVTA